MSTYHLQARLLVGPLRSPERDESKAAESGDLDELTELARDLTAQGFTVWIYDHGRPARLAGASDYRTVARYPADHAAPASRARPFKRAAPPVTAVPAKLGSC